MNVLVLPHCKPLSANPQEDSEMHFGHLSHWAVPLGFPASGLILQDRLVLTSLLVPLSALFSFSMCPCVPNLLSSLEVRKMPGRGLSFRSGSHLEKN